MILRRALIAILAGAMAAVYFFCPQYHHLIFSSLAKDQPPWRFYSGYLKGSVYVSQPTVFWPAEAEKKVLPLMHRHPELFKDKRVLEIGAGAGLISLYAAKLGARQVIATDINDAAITTVNDNAKRLGLEKIIDARLVSLDNATAYAPLKEGEQIDLLISNPPYSLYLGIAPDIEAAAVVENGELGISIAHGMKKHLAPGGAAVLFYNSLFFQMLMVKMLKAEGFTVRYHPSHNITSFEALGMFNTYGATVASTYGLDSKALKFDWERDHFDHTHFIIDPGPQEYLINADDQTDYAGMIFVR